MGLTVPFLGGDGLDQPSILGLPGNAADGVVISTVYCPEAEDERVRVFKSRLYERYKCYPDVWAVQGYDAVRLLCSSFIGAKSTIPSIVSSYMHFLVSGHGVMGMIPLQTAVTSWGKRHISSRFAMVSFITSKTPSRIDEGCCNGLWGLPDLN